MSYFLWISSVAGFFSGGWYAHKLYVRQMWRIERSARYRAQGRK